MKAVASQSNSDSPPARKQQAPGPSIPVSPWIITVSVNTGPLIQRKSNCACGGDCPRCQDESHRPRVQTKLSISTPNDPYEQEADRIADQVMRMPETDSAESSAIKPQVGFLQRKCAADEGGPDEGQLVLRQTVPAADERRQAPPVVSQVIQTSGQPLDVPTRAFFEPRFGRDLSQVRVHTDANAAESAAAVNALAYTVDRDIVFAEGRYAPDTSSGRNLLAHELTHVVQQQTNRSSAMIQRSIAVLAPDIVPTHLVSGFMSPTVRQATPPEYVDRTCGAVVTHMLNMLCPEGSWTVNPDTGLVSSTVENFCAGEGLRNSSRPASCGCLCELTGANALNVVVHITDKEMDAEGNESSVRGSLAQHGEGLTRTNLAIPLSGRVFHVAVSGLGHAVLGVGDTSVAADPRGQKQLRDPGWLILGHEMCGHVRRDLSRPGGRDFEHTSSEDYNTSAVDVENAIRREHSTTTDSLGIRFGEFFDFSGCRHRGLVYEIKFGARVITLHNKFNIPHEFMMSQDADAITTDSFVNCRHRRFDPHSPQQVFKHVFAFRTDQPVAFIMSDCDNHSFNVHDKMFLEGVFAHRVIQGETKTTIARMWNVDLNKMSVANQDITPTYNGFTETETLPVGMVIIIPYDRGAASAFFSC